MALITNVLTQRAKKGCFSGQTIICYLCRKDMTDQPTARNLFFFQVVNGASELGVRANLQRGYQVDTLLDAVGWHLWQPVVIVIHIAPDEQGKKEHTDPEIRRVIEHLHACSLLSQCFVSSFFVMGLNLLQRNSKRCPLNLSTFGTCCSNNVSFF